MSKLVVLKQEIRSDPKLMVSCVLKAERNRDDTLFTVQQIVAKNEMAVCDEKFPQTRVRRFIAVRKNNL
jgi:hypothetical protein